MGFFIPPTPPGGTENSPVLQHWEKAPQPPKSREGRQIPLRPFTNPPAPKSRQVAAFLALRSGRPTRRTAVILVLLMVLTFIFFLASRFWESLFSPPPLTLRFLYYTNNTVRDRIAVMEVSNRTDKPYQWSLRSHSKPVDHLVAVTDLVETNGQLLPVSPYNGDNLFGHDARQFGTTDFKSGEQFWVEANHYPKTSAEIRRAKLAGWFWKIGLRRVAPYVGQGQRIHGPELPPDDP